MKRKHRRVLFILLSLAIISFIFNNSLQSGQESNLQSGQVAAWLQPILNPFGHIPEDVFHRIIRKLAHFAEFGALGVCLTGALLNGDIPKRSMWITPVWEAFIVAVTDEAIQCYSGRTSMFQDVLIDLSGAVFGVLAVAIVLYLRRISGRKTEGNDKWPN